MFFIKRFAVIASCSLSRLPYKTVDAFHSSVRPYSSYVSVRAIPASASAKTADNPSVRSTITTNLVKYPLRQRLISSKSTSLKTRRNFFTSSAIALAAFSSPLPSSSVSFPKPSQIQDTCQRSTTTLSMATGETNEVAQLSTGYLNAEDAAALDAELMSTPGFSLEQLMELAGLSVAEAVYEVAMGGEDEQREKERKKHVLLVCGPGNNGGDGLVAARHLVHFGFDATIVYPKPSSKTHFINLIKQCEDMGIPVLDKIPTDENAQHYDVIVDSIFGFSFRGTAPREPFATAIRQMVQLQKESSSSVSKAILVSVDVPSGWDVDGGDLTGTNFHPDVLVSLTAPKLSAKKFVGRHFVGGRFLPPAIAEKYGIRMPAYPGVAQVVEV